MKRLYGHDGERTNILRGTTFFHRKLTSHLRPQRLPQQPPRVTCAIRHSLLPCLPPAMYPPALLRCAAPRCIHTSLLHAPLTCRPLSVRVWELLLLLFFAFAILFTGSLTDFPFFVKPYFLTVCSSSHSPVPAPYCADGLCCSRCYIYPDTR